MGAKDKLVARLIKLGKKYKLLKYPVLILTTMILAGYHILYNLLQYGKLYAVVITTVIICSISSSFVTPVKGVSAYAEEITPQMREENQNQTDEKKAVIEPIEDDIWQADDYLFEDEELVYADDEAVAERSVSEGLESDHEIVIYDSNGKALEAAFEDDWKLLLVNKQNPVPEGYTFELGVIKGNMKLDARIIDPTIAMLQAAQKEGVTLVICSAFRDYNRQSVLFNKKINAYTKRGLSYWDAYAKTSYSVTIPGTSEHEMGMAMDIVCSSYYTLDAGYADTTAGQWLAENSYKYGFILRYPLGKENITGITFEPWHFRYVGVEAATEMTVQGITLEEYVEQIGLK